MDGWPWTTEEPAAAGPTSLTILVVCTGNICRSPVAEQLLSAKLAAAGIRAVVHSAGTRALVGHDMTPESAVLSQQLGGDPAGHAARQLTAELIDGADLIVTATREHRSETVSLLPRASRRTFTLNQLARLVEASNASAGAPPVAATSSFTPTSPFASAPFVEPTPLVERTPRVEPVETKLRAYIAELAASRGETPPPLNAADDDIIDPYRQSQEVYDEVGRIIDDAVATIVAGFARASDRA